MAKTKLNSNFGLSLPKALFDSEFGVKRPRFGCHDATANRLTLWHTLSLHEGCVNTVEWSDDGRLLLSGSDDRSLIVTDPFDVNQPIRYRIRSGHKGNIFCAKFLPETDNKSIVSCAADGTIALTDVEREDLYGKQMFYCHGGTVYEVATIAHDPFSFLSCGEDGCIRLFDRREKTACTLCKEDVILDCDRPTCAIDTNPMLPFQLAVGCSDGLVRLYDMRRLSKSKSDPTGYIGLVSLMSLHSSAEAGRKVRRVTSVEFSADGNELLASFSSDHVYIFSVTEHTATKSRIEPSDSGFSLTNPPKKVRLRGDWSDTGPTSSSQTTAAADNGDGGDTSGSTMIHRFRNFLTGWMESQMNERQATSGGEEVPLESTSQQRQEAEDTTEMVVGETAESTAPSPSRAECLAQKKRRLLQLLLQSRPQNRILAVFKGHRNARTMLKQACFWGAEHVMSGSDCGHVIVWKRRRNDVGEDAGLPIIAAVGDNHVVNCVRPNPHFPVLATSGIEYNVKLWMPIAEQPYTDSSYITELVARNARMLEETRDTVTIPAAYLIRMIAVLNRNRRRRTDETDEGAELSTADDTDDEEPAVGDD